MKFPWQKKSISIHLNGSTIEKESLSYRVYSFSETGPTRSSNEDSITYFFPDNAKQSLFALVADGMGGHNAGEVASHIACQVAEEFMLQEHLHDDPAVMLHALIQTMHYAIGNAADSNEAYRGMGTTATMLFMRDQHIVFGHVGDSRLYRFGSDILEQLSTDQTLVNQMVREGKIKPHEAASHDMKHVLLQALGTVKEIDPEISVSTAVRKGECYFLCSDGVYDVLSHSELHALLAVQQPDLAMECIKALCYSRNAGDNVSALLVEVTATATSTSNTITREQNAIL